MERDHAAVSYGTRLVQGPQGGADFLTGTGKIFLLKVHVSNPAILGTEDDT